MDVSKVKNIDIEKIVLPEMIKIENKISDLHSIDIFDIFSIVKEQIAKTKFKERNKSGLKVAITAGSRDIDQFDKVIKAVAMDVKELGGIPFIIPAMGSHGGGEAEGQVTILKSYGITEKYIGAPIISSMNVVKIGKTKSEIPVYIDKNAMLADAIIVLNRIKAHTDFTGEIESGLIKMMVVGLGKHKGASIVHKFKLELFSKIIPEIASVILKKAPIALGIALIENGFGKLCKIKAIEPSNFLKEEKILLKEQKKSMHKIPVKNIDILVINEIGKDISGAGMDPNIIGRSKSAEKNIGKNIKIIIPLDLSKKTCGNAAGIGLADLTTKKLFNKIDFNITYTNFLTSNVYLEAKIPMVLKDDEFAIKTAIKLLSKNDKNVRLVRIQNTRDIKEMEISIALLEEVQNKRSIKVLGTPRRLKVDFKGKLLDYPYI